MGRFSGTLLCTDFDGTLASPDGSVSSRNLEAIRWFQEEGGLFTVASGRSPEFLKNLVHILRPNAPVMALNGGLIVDYISFRVLDSCFLPDDILTAVKALCAPGTCQIDLWYGEGELLRWKRDENRSLADAFAKARPPFYKAVLIEDTPEQAVSLRLEAIERYKGRFLFERSWPVGLEVLPSHGGKGAALKRIKRLCPGVARVAGMGDYENDVSLVREADIGIAVENALPCVKEVCDAVSAANDSDAVCHAIHNLL